MKMGYDMRIPIRLIHRQHVLQHHPAVSPGNHPPRSAGPSRASAGKFCGSDSSHFVHRYACRHRHCRHRRTDKRVNFVLTAQVHQLHQHPRTAVPIPKGNHTQQQECWRLRLRELSPQFCAHRQPEMVTILISPFCTVSLRRSTAPLSRIRLPKRRTSPAAARRPAAAPHQHEQHHREEDFFPLTHRAQLHHADFPLRLPWSALSQSAAGLTAPAPYAVRRHRDGFNGSGASLPDGHRRRAVRAADDDADGRRLRQN